MGKVSEVAGSRVTAFRPPDGVDGRSPLPQSPRAYLAEIVSQKRILLANGSLTPFYEPRSAGIMLDAFRRSDYFLNHVYPALVHEALKPDGDLSDVTNSTRYPGFLFESISYLSTAARFAKEGKVVLSPEETHQFFRRLYPDKEETIHPYEMKSLMGVYQPDGLIIDPGTKKVTGMVEYKLHNGQQNFESQTCAFHRHRRSHPEFFRGIPFHFLTPLGFHREPYHQGKDIEFSTIQLTGARLNLFKDELFETFSPYGTGATLADMVSRRDTQLGLMANRERRDDRLSTAQTVYVGRQRQLVPLPLAS